jgi:hypothetical protein
VNAHRPLTPKDDLAGILTRQETRLLSKNLTLQFEKIVYQIQTDRPTYTLRKAKRLPPKPAPDHPWRTGFATPLSKRGNATHLPKGDISILENR